MTMMMTRVMYTLVVVDVASPEVLGKDVDKDEKAEVVVEVDGNNDEVGLKKMAVVAEEGEFLVVDDYNHSVDLTMTT